MTNKMGLKEIQEMLDEKLETISAPLSCVNSRVPGGRTWCDYYNQTFAGRCNHNCPGYENKYVQDRVELIIR